MRAFVERGIPYAPIGTARRRRTSTATPSRATCRPCSSCRSSTSGAIRARGFRVAYDACRGAGGAIIPHLLELLGCEVHAINLETDGRFPAAARARAREPRRSRAAREGHGRRRSASRPTPTWTGSPWCRNEGEAIGEDYTLAFACRVVLRHRKGHVVTNLSTSRVVDDAAAEYGQRVIRAPVGEVNVALRIRSEKRDDRRRGERRRDPPRVAPRARRAARRGTGLAATARGSPHGVADRGRRSALLRSSRTSWPGRTPRSTPSMRRCVRRFPDAEATRRTGCAWAGTIVGCTYGLRGPSRWFGSSPRRRRSADAQKLVERGRELLARRLIGTRRRTHHVRNHRIRRTEAGDAAAHRGTPSAWSTAATTPRASRCYDGEGARRSRRAAGKIAKLEAAIAAEPVDGTRRHRAHALGHARRADRAQRASAPE